ncbi:MAG: hypothetical protein ACHQ7M_19460 [Chloroflexota bacterium]
MKTTVDLDPELIREAKKAAIDRGSTLRALIEAGLRQQLAGPNPALKPIRWVAVGGPAPWPDSVDISSRKSMWDWMDTEERKPGRD